MSQQPSILITGGSGGIGSAAAKACAAKGARIAIHYNSHKDRAEAVLAELPGDGHRIYQGDITDPEVVQQLIEDVHNDFSGLDVLVNNAGISQRQNISEIDYATWQSTWHKIMQTNLTSTANLSFCASQKMLQQGGGRIVNISSRGAFRGEPLMPWYGASKAGMNALGQSMAQALGPKSIFIYTVAPGFVETEMATSILTTPEGDLIRNQSPMGRVAQPEEIASTIAFLALEAPEFMTGSIIDVNGASYLRS